MLPQRNSLTRKILSGQSREIVANVLQYLKNESTECRGYLRTKDESGVESKVYIGDVQKRCVAATGVSLRTIQNISKEKRRIEGGEEKSFSTPNKKKKRSKPKSDMEEFDKGVVRRTVHRFIEQEKCVPTLRSLCRKLAEDIGFTGGKDTLRLILREIGFRWRKTKKSRKVLVEKHDVKLRRIDYLLAIRRYREEGRPIVYTDESYILTSHATPKSFGDNSDSGHAIPAARGERLNIVHAGGEGGFVPHALIIRKADRTVEEHHRMTRTEYEKWLRERLIPNLPPNTVLVVDDAAYQNFLIENAPTSCAEKAEMIEWLVRNRVPHETSLLKPQLYRLILAHKPKPKYAIDEILNSQGHTALRLPPYHPDLNPLEMIWDTLKMWVASRNVTFKAEDVKSLCETKIAETGAADWSPFCEWVKGIEEEYLRREHVIDREMEPIIVQHGGFDSDSSDWDSRSDDDNDADPDNGESSDARLV